MLETLKKNWRYLFITPLFFTALLTAHIKHYQISFFSSEVFMAYAVLIFLGFCLGFLIVFSKKFFRILLLTMVFSLLILSQINFMPNLPYFLNYLLVLLLVIILYLIIYYGLVFQPDFDKFLVIFFAIIWVQAFFISDIPFINNQKYPPKRTHNKELPPYVEIVLDEHIGFGGIAPSKNENSILETLRDKYIQHGFRVYGGVYSREKFTIMSFSNFLNFKTSKQYDKYLSRAGRGHNIIIRNKLFEILSKKGYLINVIQTNYLDLCKTRNINLTSCITYQFNNLNQVEHFQNLAEKTFSIISSVFHVFHLNSFMEKFANNPFLLNLRLPRNVIPEFPFPSSGYRIFSKVIDQAKHIRKGNAYFIHILLPHSPYVFDKKCNYSYLRVSESEAYFNQIQCTHRLMNQFLQELSENPEAKNSTLVVHGDHGSRIKPLCDRRKKACILETIIKVFSTFFIVRSPLYKPGYDPAQLPLDNLLKDIVLQKKISPVRIQQEFVNIRVDENLRFIKKTPIHLFERIEHAST